MNASGTCSGLPVTLAPGSSCTRYIAFAPVVAGETTGSVTVSGAGFVPQSVRLAGTGLQGDSAVTLIADSASALVGQPVTLTATVKPFDGGSVSFYDGTTQLGTAQILSSPTASVIVTSLQAGTHSVTAVYSGSANLAGSTSASVSELIGDFDFSIASNGTDTSTGSVNQTVTPGQPATFAFNIQPLAGPFNFPVTLSATGLPPGATVTFSPQIVTVGPKQGSFTMTIQTPARIAGVTRTGNFRGVTLALALLWLPYSGAIRRRARHLGPLTSWLLVVGAGVVLTTLTGCAGGNGFFGQAYKTYTIQVVGTAKAASGSTLQHVADVQLTLQ